MRGDIIFRVYGVHGGREEDVYFGDFRTREEAQAEISQLRLMNGRDWTDRYHDKGFVIRETVVESDYEIPSRPKPRDKYVVTLSAKPNRPGTWNSTLVEVFRRNLSTGNVERICEYERNHAMYQTFEPFRQGNREFALISRNYTRTAVLDLASGMVIAEEAQDGSPGGGFCPVGFYVPDWWDVNDGSKLPGSKFWSADDEWPSGDFGFVWGCCWADDSSWKVQYLDLTQVQQGVIRRDDRFGYVELATFGFKTPCLTRDPEVLKKSEPPHFIDVSRNRGISKVTFAVEMAFSLDSGKSADWQRLRTVDFE
jgi:hypothetical protein